MNLLVLRQKVNKFEHHDNVAFKSYTYSILLNSKRSLLPIAFRFSLSYCPNNNKSSTTLYNVASVIHLFCLFEFNRCYRNKKPN